MLKIVTKTRVLILIIILLGIFAGNQSFKAQDLKYTLITYKSIPHIELSNVQFVSKGEFYAYIKGFVVFEDESDQPRDLRQYYIIEPLFKFDENGKRLYSLKEIIALYPLPPRELGENDVVLKTQEESESLLVLADDVGNLFFINKLTKEVTTRDTTGDSTRLITSDTEYRDFMREFLK